MAKIFSRNKENFKCEHCGVETLGDGYTNHCPACLWSKHVDVNPGDRLAQCGGMMRPVCIETHSAGFSVVQVCEKCGMKKRNKLVSGDNMEEAIRIQQKYGQKESGL